MSSPNDWLIARWQRNGFPVLVRMATAYRELGPVPGYDHRIVVVVPLKAPQRSGMPQREEFDALDAVEQSICDLLEAESDCLGVLAITGCGTRDLIFYSRNPEKAREKLAQAQALITSHQIDAAIEPDEAWELYGFFNRTIAASPAAAAQTQMSG